MTDITVSLASNGDPMRFSVVVRETDSRSEHDVTAAKADVERLSRSGETPEDFLERVFEFLLAREPKESILSSFDVSVISRYFPEFENEISS
jgi:hypothetical protein